MQTPDDPFFQLTDKHLRDLTWALTSPSLLDCSWSAAQPQWFPQLQQQAGSPASWQRIKHSKHSRLGLIFESLWHEWLQHSDWRWDANIQISQYGRTLGELDLLIDTGEQHCHIELAMKFYLGIGNDWIGPNRRDRLANKIRHTREQQLPLSRQAEAQQQLAAMGWHPTDSEAVFRGCLFYPADSTVTAQLPQEVNRQHWQGRWCHASAVPNHITEGFWVILARDEWLSPVLSPVAASAADVIQLLGCHFRHLQVPLCLARVKPLQQQSTGQQQWAEQQRWMVVADRWPD